MRNDHAVVARKSHALDVVFNYAEAFHETASMDLGLFRNVNRE
jgi:hypothetical protein